MKFKYGDVVEIDNDFFRDTLFLVVDYEASGFGHPDASRELLNITLQSLDKHKYTIKRSELLLKKIKEK